MKLPAPPRPGNSAHLVLVHVTDLRAGDVMVYVTDMFHPERWGRMLDPPIPIKEVHVTGVDALVVYGNWGDWRPDMSRWFMVHREVTYANPESAARLRDYLTATCHLDL